MSWFKSADDIVLDMVADFYFLTGQQLSPTDLSREEIIKIRQMSIQFSHAYAQIDRAADDIFPGSASLTGLINGLAARQMDPRIDAAPSTGTIQRTGTAGQIILAGARMRRISDGSLFYQFADATLDGMGQVLTVYKSVLSGQNQNIDILNDQFTAVSPQALVDNAGTNSTLFTDGRDIETPQEILARITQHDQAPNTGGNLIAYEEMAAAASGLVVTAQAIKQPRGAGTVDIVITSGTTDIAAAVENDESVTRIPSDDLLATVQAYIDAHDPTTDDALAIAPVEDFFDTTIAYELIDETQRSLVSVKVNQIWQIFVYSAPSNQYVDPTALERLIDAQLGFLMIRRRVSNFNGGTPQYLVPEGHLLKPGTLTQNTSP